MLILIRMDPDPPFNLCESLVLDQNGIIIFNNKKSKLMDLLLLVLGLFYLFLQSGVQYDVLLEVFS